MEQSKYILTTLIVVLSNTGTPGNADEAATAKLVPVYAQLLLSGECAKPASPSLNKPDFNGDGCADLVVGEPTYNGTHSQMGRIHVIYGTPEGLRGKGNQTWDRNGGYDENGNNIGDIQYSSAVNDQFGSVIATGDFDGDGFTDVVIGVPLSSAGGDADAGAVQVIYGSRHGLTAKRNQSWDQDGGWDDPNGTGSAAKQGDIYGGTEPYDYFGSALAAGDFNNDSYDDLAVGVDGEDIGSISNAGAVNVIYGSPNGLTWIRNVFLSQAEFRRENNGNGTYSYLGDLIGGAEDGDRFGDALAAGDLNGDDFDELFVGAYGEAIGSLSAAGAVNILRGSGNGLIPENNVHLHQQAAYRDTNGDGTVDITIGNPDGVEDSGDWFGKVLTTGDFDGDSYADIAISVPLEDFYVDGIEYINAGVVQVFYGSSGGLTLISDWWQQDGEYRTGAMFGSDPENNDQFGDAIASGDINGDGIDDLAIGTPNEDLSAAGINVGSVNVVYGTSNGLDLPGHQWFSPVVSIGDSGQQLGDLAGEANDRDNFGTSLTISDFDGDGFGELAIGVPGFQASGNGDEIGGVNVLKGHHGGLRLTNNQIWTLWGGATVNGSPLGNLWGSPQSGTRFGRALSRGRGR